MENVYNPDWWGKWVKQNLKKKAQQLAKRTQKIEQVKK